MQNQSASPTEEHSPAATPSAVTVPEVMKAVVARSYGTPDVVAVEDVPVPVPASNEVLLRVEASSLNALDWHFLTGTPYLLRMMNGLRRPKRIIHGADIAGTVIAIGVDVTRFALGDKVFGESGGGGGFAPFATVGVCGDEVGMVKVPNGVSFEDAGATPVAGLTALQGLRTHADVQPGEHVLINGAAGGVGTFAVQVAVALGAEVTAVCSTRNVDMVRSLGATHVVDYVHGDFVPGGQRFDVMIDNVGNRSAAECLSVLKSTGRYVAISGPKDNPWTQPMAHVARTALKFRRAEQSFHQFTASPNHDDLTFLGDLLSTGQLKPAIQRVIGLDEVAEGLTEIGTGHARAKIVVTPN